MATRKPRPDPAWPTAKGGGGSTPEPFTNASRGIRLQKAMAEAGVASRRDCEALIVSGRVRVNGQPIRALPAWVDTQRDVIEVDGEPLPGTSICRGPKRLSRQDATRRKAYIMVYKPRRVISTNEDPQGRKRVIDLVQAPAGARLFLVGRLDAESTGLMLLTNDGELANRLTHPRYEVPKQYDVCLRGHLKEDDLRKLRDGLYLTVGRKAGGGRGGRTAMESVTIVKRQTDRTRGDRTTLAVTLREGRNREIRRLVARLGYKVRRLKRTAIGPLKLKGLAIGQWRTLTHTEVKRLYKAAGLTGQRHR